MARTAAQEAAFQKCLAARNKAKVTKMSPPEYVAVPKEEPPAPVEPVPAPVPEPVAPEPPVTMESDDSDYEILDGNELISVISQQQKDLESVRAELSSLKNTHDTSLLELTGRYTELSDSFKKARIQAAHSINFVD